MAARGKSRKEKRVEKADPVSEPEEDDEDQDEDEDDGDDGEGGSGEEGGEGEASGSEAEAAGSAGSGSGSDSGTPRAAPAAAGGDSKAAPAAPAAAKSPRKKSRKQRDAELDLIVKQFRPRKLTASQAVIYTFFALTLSALPAFLFVAVYDVSLAEYGWLLGVCVLASTVALFDAYMKLTNNTHAKLSNARKFTDVNAHKKLNLSKEKLDAIQESVTRREAVAWGVALSNAVYGLAWLFLAFYMFRDVPAHYNYALSQLAAAGAVWQMGSFK